MNEKLRTARIRACLSERDVCATIGADIRTYQRWEHGKSIPQPYYRRKLCELFHLSLEDLGYDPLTLICSQIDEIIDPPARSSQVLSAAQITDAEMPSSITTNLVDIVDLGALVLKLAQQCHGWSEDELQTRWEHAMKKFDGEKLSRRDTLGLLAGLPLAALGLAQIEGSGQSISVEEVLPHAKATLVSAWKLAKGSDLSLAQQIVSSYLPVLATLAKQPSEHQEEAARLAAQNYILNGLIEMHLNNMDAREVSCQEAVKYAEISGDVNLLTSARRWLGCTYYYEGNVSKAMQVYEAAGSSLDSVVPLLRSSVLVETAVIHARQKQKQDALRSLSMAHEAFGDATEDQNLLYVGHDIGVLTLWAALTHYDLGNYRQAHDTLLQIDGLDPKKPVSERIRLQILNNQALIAVKLNNLEQARVYIEAGAKGAIALGSKLRFAEAGRVYQIMEFMWPDEAQVQEIKPLFLQKL